MSIKFAPMLFQGDVMILPLPKEMFVKEFEGEIPAINGKLILQEGEVTGHHHAIDVLERPATAKAPATGGDANAWLAKNKTTGSAKMFRATKIAQELVSKRALTRADLIVGLLVVEGNPVNVSHQEHTSIMLAPGQYVVGRQIESVAGEERRVTD
jgi:hypothetical protein